METLSRTLNTVVKTKETLKSNNSNFQNKIVVTLSEYLNNSKFKLS